MNTANSNENAKKKVKQLLIMCLIFSIAIAVILLCYYFSSNVKKIRYLNSTVISNEEDVKQPINMYMITSSYKGSFPKEAIKKYVYNFAYNVIPEYVKLDSLEIESYYEENKNYIKQLTGIESYENFSKFINDIKKCGVNLQLENYVLNPDSINKESEYISADLYIKYKNSDPIKFEISIIGNEKMPIKFISRGIDIENIYQNLIPENVGDNIKRAGKVL